MKTGLADRLLDALPQTQCQRCGYSDCRDYARAIAEDGVAINRCPPGGSEGIARLGALTHQPPLPLDSSCGSEAPLSIAQIVGEECIGCALCIPVCPTDAIIGAKSCLHVVHEVYCTGCALCLPACPVDCIRMEAVSGTRTGWDAWSGEQAATARERYDFHSARRSLHVRRGAI